MTCKLRSLVEVHKSSGIPFLLAIICIFAFAGCKDLEDNDTRASEASE